ncbi:ribosomal protein L4 domain-containing protein [Emericellopsis atlantica]|uniref:Large ribosomal subunit protein uL4m n=1 Tax=Emericellopsis atlantica TaxID=2614577 RepID=A0A9P7ZJG7_9HYPO|nr:ribosomal protein L4 domain-containing protein [Emericellopsis atlantica]KAG9252877.1 ribosomal protein L4 domain-containing protein [Emericellopsis atlantica]
MAAKGIGCLSEAMGALRLASKPSHLKTITRSMATTTEASTANITRSVDTQTILNSWHPSSSVPVTIHAFPSLEPTSLEQFAVEHLYLPMRRDILHLAVVYEGDNTRLGTARALTRAEVRGSTRKVRPQKGTGRARLGSSRSPSLRGGGKAHGPRQRDFGTKLNRKVYDKAWRTALSYRYRRGELIVTEDGMDMAYPEEFELTPADKLKFGLRERYLAKYMREALMGLGLGKPDGRTLFVTEDRRTKLFEAMEYAGPSEGRALDMEDVDVKDLLETGKVVMERSVLKELIKQHESDLVSKVVINGFAPAGPQSGVKVLGA